MLISSGNTLIATPGNHVYWASLSSANVTHEMSHHTSSVDGDACVPGAVGREHLGHQLSDVSEPLLCH